MKNNFEKVTIAKLKRFDVKDVEGELNRRFLSRATDEQLLKALGCLDKKRNLEFFNSLN